MATFPYVPIPKPVTCLLPANSFPSTCINPVIRGTILQAQCQVYGQNHNKIRDTRSFMSRPEIRPLNDFFSGFSDPYLPIYDHNIYYNENEDSTLPLYGQNKVYGKINKLSVPFQGQNKLKNFILPMYSPSSDNFSDKSNYTFNIQNIYNNETYKNTSLDLNTCAPNTIRNVNGNLVCSPISMNSMNKTDFVPNKIHTSSHKANGENLAKIRLLMALHCTHSVLIIMVRWQILL